MNELQALVLGILQGLTEFLPVSSSGHLEIGKAIFGIHDQQSLTFTVVVHSATVLSTIVVFWNDIVRLLKAPFTFKWNDDNKYIAKLLLSAVPVAIVGLFFEEEVESLFGGNLLLVGLMLWVTSFLLLITIWAPNRQRPISFRDAFIIGIAQALAVVPGISRSGATIATGLMLGNDKQEVAKFSFLMVLIPIIGATLKDVYDYLQAPTVQQAVPASSLIVGFFAAFITGLFACKFMLRIVRNSKLSYFAIYTFIVGAIAIYFGLKA